MKHILQERPWKTYTLTYGSRKRPLYVYRKHLTFLASFLSSLGSAESYAIRLARIGPYHAFALSDGNTAEVHGMQTKSRVLASLIASENLRT